jgi:putative endonuclease
MQRSTKHRTPFELVYYEAAESKQMALMREKQIKSYKGGEAFKKLLFGK